MSVNQVVFDALVPWSDWKIWTLPIWRHLLKRHKKVAGLGPLLLMSLSRIGNSGMGIHAWLYLNLFIAHSLWVCFAIQSDCLFLVTDSLNAAIVKLLEGSWHNNLNCGHWGQFGLVNATEGWPKKWTFNLCAIFVTDVVEGVVFQEIVVENRIAVLLVNIPLMEKSVFTFDALSEGFNAILVINGFPLNYKFGSNRKL